MDICWGAGVEPSYIANGDVVGAKYCHRTEGSNLRFQFDQVDV